MLPVAFAAMAAVAVLSAQEPFVLRRVVSPPPTVFAPALVHGKLLDASGAPVVGAELCTQSQPGWGTIDRGRTGSDGSFDLRSSDRWPVQLWQLGADRAACFASSIPAYGDVVETGVWTAPVPAAVCHWVRGTVRWSNGEPIGGVRITAQGGDAEQADRLWPSACALTAADGTFSLPVAGYEGLVLRLSSGGGRLGIKHRADVVGLTAAKDTKLGTQAELDLREAVDLRVPGVWIDYTNEAAVGATLQRFDSTWWSLPTLRDFVLESPVSSRVSMRLLRAGHLPRRFLGETLGAQLTELLVDPATFALEVVDAAGAPLPATVDLVDDATYSAETLPTNARGELRLLGKPSDRPAIRVRAPGHAAVCCSWPAGRPLRVVLQSCAAKLVLRGLRDGEAGFVHARDRVAAVAVVLARAGEVAVPMAAGAYDVVVRDVDGAAVRAVAVEVAAGEVRTVQVDIDRAAILRVGLPKVVPPQWRLSIAPLGTPNHSTNDPYVRYGMPVSLAYQEDATEFAVPIVRTGRYRLVAERGSLRCEREVEVVVGRDQRLELPPLDAAIEGDWPTDGMSFLWLAPRGGDGWHVLARVAPPVVRRGIGLPAPVQQTFRVEQLPGGEYVGWLARSRAQVSVPFSLAPLRLSAASTTTMPTGAVAIAPSVVVRIEGRASSAPNGSLQFRNRLREHLLADPPMITNGFASPEESMLRLDPLPVVDGKAQLLGVTAGWLEVRFLSAAGHVYEGLIELAPPRALVLQLRD